MNTKQLFYLTIGLLLILFSCSSSDEAEYSDADYALNEMIESELDFLPPSEQKYAREEMTKTYEPSDDDGIDDYEKKEGSEENDETANIEKKIIKTAYISFGVSEYKESRMNIDSLIKKHKAYVSSENENNSSYSISNTIIIRVPAENFEKLLSDLEGEATEFESKSINTSDVTEEYVDILTRLENKKKVEAQYVELLKKARTIAEILEVNEHIRVLREEIEAKEGRLRYLKNQVGFSTITLYMHQDYDTVSYGFFHKIGDALSGGWDGFLTFIIGLIYIWPLILIGIGIWLLIRKAVRKRRKRKATN